MEDDQIQLVLTYIETAYESLGMKPPRKEDGKIDVIRAKGFLMQMAFQEKIVPLEVWQEEMTGEYQGPEWSEIADDQYRNALRAAHG